MDLLIILLAPFIFITAIIISLLKISKGRRLLVFSSIIAIPFLIFFGDEIFGQIYLKTICKKNGGYEYKEKIKADGYFDTDYDKGCGLSCLEALTKWGFSYYETNVQYSHPYHANEKGFYIYYLINKDLEHCSGGREIPRERGIIPEDKCVAYKKLTEPLSKYEVSMIRNTDFVEKPFRMTKVSSYIKDRKRDEIVASATSYRYWGGWVRNNSFGHNTASVCPSFKESHGMIIDIITTSNDR